MKLRRAALTALVLPLFGGLGSCSGGDVNLGPSAPAPGPAGYYSGEWISPVTGEDHGAVALISGDGEARIIDPRSHRQYLVTLPAAGGSYSTGLTGYAGPLFHLPDGSDVCQGNASGELDPAAELFGNYACGGDQGTFSLAFDDSLSFNPPDVGSLTGEWQSFLSPTVVLVLIVSPDGSFTGSDTAGCSYQGGFTAADPIVNLYELTLTQSCGSASLTLTGRAAETGSTQGGQQALYYGVSDAGHSLAGMLLLQ